MAEANNRVRVVLINIRLAARDTNLYTFAPLEGGTLPPSRPGAHIGLYLPNGMERQYSLLYPEEKPAAYAVGIKKDGKGRGGSRWIHENLRVGMELSIALPRNNFELKEDVPNSVLMAGGIGITPIYSMTQRLRQLNRPFELFYACRSRSEMAFFDELRGENKVHLHFDDESEPRFLPIDRIISEAAAGTHFYCCGPTPMLAAFESAGKASGRPADEFHAEYFTQKFAAADEGGYVVELARTGRSFEIPSGKAILRVLLDAGIPVPFSCEEGVCGTCETRVLEGVPDHRDSLLSEAERAANASMMICCSGSKTKKLVLDI